MKTPMRTLIAMVALATVALGNNVYPSAYAAPPNSGSTKITVNFETPEGVPGLVTLTSKRGTAVATKGPEGTSSSVTLDVPPGLYAVTSSAVMADRLRYVGVSSPRNLQLSTGETKQVTVTYSLSQGVQEAHLTNVTATGIELAWTVPAGTDLYVRRTEGDVAATSPSQGVEVISSESGLSDSGLKPGTRYNYSLWAKPGDSAFGVDQSNGPVILTVGTEDSSGTGIPSYVVTPGTLLAQQADLTTVETTGDGVKVQLAPGVATPAPGAAVALPISDILRGGFLGVVHQVSQDGRTLDLVAGGIGDAFDYYDLNVEDLGALPLVTLDEPTEQEAIPSAMGATSSGATSKMALPPTMLKTENLTAACGQIAVDGQVIEFDPKFKVAGHFNTKVDKYNVLGVQIPKGVSLDAKIVVTESDAIRAKVSGSVNCQVKVLPIMVTLTAAPVPISYYLKPTAKIGIEGAIDVSNVGLALTLGFEAKGYVGFDGKNYFDSRIINTAQPLSPQVNAVSGGLTVKLGAETYVGPGAGSSAAGVLVGLGGEITPLDAHASVTLPTAPVGSPCLKMTAQLGLGVMVSARAWLGIVDFEANLPIPGLHVTLDYPGSPWYWPSQCDLVANPSEDLLGDGVTMVDDAVSGSTTQWGYLDGFAPGSKAWVLSTGLVSQAQGAPEFFANTALGNPGDDQLTAYSGHSTYDAASYTVKLIPVGSTLKVKYAFASEEYPEYVGSSFNDVMAIFVDGVNCATVPGTVTPVSINTINDHTNSEYYVDNSTGASGYDTSYDGITKPLVCSVPVTPGVPVSVRIAVADASDSAYDSAVALLDNGIWSE